MCKAVLWRSCQYVKYRLYIEASHQTLSDQTDSANISPWKFIKIHTGICSSHTNVPLRSAFCEHSQFVYHQQPIYTHFSLGRVSISTHEYCSSWPSGLGQRTCHRLSYIKANYFLYQREFKIMQYYKLWKNLLSAEYFCRVLRIWSFAGRYSVRGKIH